ncbi:amidohydrolase [Aestuariicella sp. G3-2]|uniref:amidohydrolase family protein n=1 Tax=Pseudomaricurvus albidus TaxID=2842452 RepID=UPI001C0D0A36|nr:amidohydrolase family protein [Aestuariicella albida]MBU3068692.1 amidohydrolase [Aestuariicella albida]
MNNMANYVQGRIVHDADAHIMETQDWLEPYLSGEGADKLNDLYDRAPDFIREQIEAARQRKGNAEAEAAAAEKLIDGPKGWVAYGAFDPEERSVALDKMGFQTQLVFGTFSLGTFTRLDDETLVYKGARAANDAMAEFCRKDPRLIYVAYIPLNNTEKALDELDRVLAAGAGAIQVSTGPAGDRSPGHVDLDPFWQKLQDRGVPFVLHIGPGTMTQPSAYHNNGRERAPDIHGGGENLRFPDYIMLSYGPQIFLTAMVYDGVFERFPRLKGGVIECGAGWVPEFLRELDISFKSFSKTDPYLQAMTLTPSEQIRRAVKFTPFPKEDLKRMIDDAGPELFMFSSDYPHPEGTTDPLGYFEGSIEDLDEAIKDQFYRANFEAMLPWRFAN